MELLPVRAVSLISERFGGYAYYTVPSHAKVTTPTAVWLNRGKQRRAVAQALTRPLTQAEIWKLARLKAESVQLRDVWAILRDFKARGLIYCLNPTVTTGKLFYWTDAGKRVAQRTFHQILGLPEKRVNWARYTLVARAPVRHKVLTAIAEKFGSPEYATATAIRRRLREHYPIGINSVLRALAELARVGLVRSDITDGRKVYQVSQSGKTILRALKGHSERVGGSA
jgi:Fe2+ or Zn2+ uptake regulation protein